MSYIDAEIFRKISQSLDLFSQSQARVLISSQLCRHVLAYGVYMPLDVTAHVHAGPPSPY